MEALVEEASLISYKYNTDVGWWTFEYKSQPMRRSEQLRLIATVSQLKIQHHASVLSYQYH